MLAGLALLTDGFTSANELELTLIVTACVVSVVALAGALSAVLLLILAECCSGPRFGCCFDGDAAYRPSRPPGAAIF
jgi:hypothetical protein